MNGAHDMGGAHGFGPVVCEDNEPAFHDEWEKRAFAMALASGSGLWNLDMSRFARENVPPQQYLARSYYEMWLEGLETLAVSSGMITAQELAAARDGEHFEAVNTPALAPEAVEAAMRRGGSTRVESTQAPAFSIGDRVRARHDSPPTHTRCPQYVRGRTGTVARSHGVFVFPDSNAHGGGSQPQHVYAVRFDADDLWGASSQGGAVYVDLWHNYLEPADQGAGNDG